MTSTTNTDRDLLKAELTIKMRDITRRNKEQAAARSHAADLARNDRNARWAAANAQYRIDCAIANLTFDLEMDKLRNARETTYMTVRECNAARRIIGDAYEAAIIAAAERRTATRHG